MKRFVLLLLLAYPSSAFAQDQINLDELGFFQAASIAIEQGISVETFFPRPAQQSFDALREWQQEVNALEEYSNANPPTNNSFVRLRHYPLELGRYDPDRNIFELCAPSSVLIQYAGSSRPARGGGSIISNRSDIAIDFTYVEQIGSSNTLCANLGAPVRIPNYHVFSNRGAIHVPLESIEQAEVLNRYGNSDGLFLHFSCGFFDTLSRSAINPRRIRCTIFDLEIADRWGGRILTWRYLQDEWVLQFMR